ncbi:MAG: hypothetical protein B6D70_14600 [gamma proteobacterium symbiont of Stewartia floridana]|uniref:Uncharacterized protein n=1 Tax=Candidatus Thiodiazotropha taylori TaxID=2792791 RepID=A0A9E4T826_9GAMM|nr:hypothetical protein [Candidatus Thiodiazotropha taylori]MCW4259241.1 hypothetical protein [Candidatus Thiodiazotropha taylori]RLW57584.1 MAG: hypothetical protein B6D70_14600 [gamma proteobacterium symbiont of Stewartia floridana]
MCSIEAGLYAGAAVVGQLASNRRNDKMLQAQKKANKPMPEQPKVADASVRRAGNLARRAAARGGQSSTRRTNPLGITGSAGNARTLLGG